MIDRAIYTSKLLFWSTMADLMGIALEQKHLFRNYSNPVRWIMVSSLLLISFMTGRVLANLLVTALP